MKNRKIKAMTLSLNPTIQSLILHMYTIFEDSSLHNSGENCDTNLAVKDRKNGQIKGRIRARSPILNPTIQQLIVHVHTKFQILAIIVPEKTVTQTILRSYVITELRSGAIKCPNNPHPHLLQAQ